MTLPPAPRALVVINGDDVYEDLFSAGLKLAEILVAAGFAARTVMGTARLADRTAANLLVLYTALGDFPPARQSALVAAVRSGAGLLAVHASNVFPGSAAGPDPNYRVAHDLIGSRFVSHGPPPHESRFRVEIDERRPVTRSMPAFGITHEHYQIETADDVEVVAWRRARAGREPVAYTRREGRGRVCYLQLGHDMRAWDDPPVREIVTRAARWAHGEETQ
jgi:type 1 glutamine amidotransferase